MGKKIKSIEDQIGCLEKKGIIFLYDTPSDKSKDFLDSMDKMDRIVEAGRKIYGRS